MVKECRFKKSCKYGKKCNVPERAARGFCGIHKDKLWGEVQR